MIVSALKPRAGPLLGTSSTALSPISVDVSKSDYSMDKTKVGSEGEEMSPTATAVDGGVMDIRLPPKVHRRERSRVRGEILP